MYKYASLSDVIQLNYVNLSEHKFMYKHDIRHVRLTTIMKTIEKIRLTYNIKMDLYGYTSNHKGLTSYHEGLISHHEGFILNREVLYGFIYHIIRGLKHIITTITLNELLIT